MSQLVALFFIVLAALNVESFAFDAQNAVHLTYAAYSHSVPSVIVTGALVATFVFTLTYSSVGVGAPALTKAFSGYVAATAHLAFLLLHHSHDIPLDFYLPLTTRSEGVKMVGYNVPHYAAIESVVLCVCVAVYAIRLASSKSTSASVKSQLFVVCAVVILGDAAMKLGLVAITTKQACLLVLAIVTQGIPFWAMLIEK